MIKVKQAGSREAEEMAAELSVNSPLITSLWSLGGCNAFLQHPPLLFWLDGVFYNQTIPDEICVYLYFKLLEVNKDMQR